MTGQRRASRRRAGAAHGLVAAYRWRDGSWSPVRLPRQAGSRVSVAAEAPSNVWILMGVTSRRRPLHWNGIRWQQLPSRVGATGLWNGRSWQIGPPLPDGSDIATIPGGPSAWMVGAWPAPRTGLTAEVRLGR